MQVRRALGCSHISSEDEGDGVVPGEFALGGVDGDAGCFLELDGIHVDGGVGDVAEDGAALAVGDDFTGDAAETALALDGVGVSHHEGAAAVVEEPGDLDVALEGPVGDAVGLEVVFLDVVHGDEQIARVRVREQKKEKQHGGHTFQVCPKGAADMVFDSQFSVFNCCADRGTRTPTLFRTRS